MKGVIRYLAVLMLLSSTAYAGECDDQWTECTDAVSEEQDDCIDACPLEGKSKAKMAAFDLCTDRCKDRFDRAWNKCDVSLNRCNRAETEAVKNRNSDPEAVKKRNSDPKDAGD